MAPTEVKLTKEIANRLGFINVEALENWRKSRETNTVEKMLVNICNLHQMVLDVKRHVERVEKRLVDAGIERIG